MYLLLFLLPILFLFLLVGILRKKKNVKRVKCMSTEEKLSLLDGIIEPFGYKYCLEDDLFSTRIQAPQREFGYSALYDKSAPHINLIFDSFPVYFDYRGKTWLLEFWKGQYGINTGAEIGLYYANRLLDPSETAKTFFRSAEDADLLRMSLALYRNDTCIAEISEKHWWLTAFRMGMFSHRSDLCLQTSITFSSCEMTNAFLAGLRKAGYSADVICRNCNTVNISFDQSPHIYGLFRRIRVRLAQCSNRLWCKIYLLTTRPFENSMDRLLYLYYFLPFAFRRCLRAGKSQRRNWKQARRRDANCNALAALRTEERQKS